MSGSRPQIWLDLHDFVMNFVREMCSMLRSLLKIFLFVLILFPRPVQAIEDLSPDGPLAWEALAEQARQFLQREDFEALETWADQLRSSRETSVSGTWKLSYLYQGLDNATLSDEKDWQRALERLTRWQTTFPDSIMLKTVLGQYWLDYAWFLRGSNLSSAAVTPEQRALLQDRLATAERILTHAVTRVGQDCPERYVVLLRLGIAQGWERERFESTYRQAIAFEPDYIPVYLVAAMYFLPRWHGAPGEWQTFARQVADADPRGMGAVIYLRIVAYIDDLLARHNLVELGVEWPLAKRGLQTLLAWHPDSRYLLNLYARFAQMADDPETARPLLAQIGDYPDLAVWMNNLETYQRARQWVGLENDKNPPQLLPPVEKKIRPSEPEFIGFDYGINLLYNAEADQNLRGWRSFKDGGVELCPDQNPCFAVRNGASLVQRLRIAPRGDSYAVLSGWLQAEVLDPAGTINDSPAFSGYLFSEQRVIDYLQYPGLRPRLVKTGTWYLAAALFTVPEKADEIQVSLGQMGVANLPHTGAAARFDRLGLKLFHHRGEAEAFLTGLKAAVPFAGK